VLEDRSLSGASGGTRPGAQALGAHQYTFCSHLKTRLSRNLGQNMLKNALEKLQKLPQRRELRLRTPLAYGGWGFRPQIPALLLPPTMAILSRSFLMLNTIYYSSKKKQNNYSIICSAFTSSVLLHLFFTLQFLLTGGRKSVSCPRAQGTLATPLTRAVSTACELTVFDMAAYLQKWLSF